MSDMPAGFAQDLLNSCPGLCRRLKHDTHHCLSIQKDAYNAQHQHTGDFFGSQFFSASGVLTLAHVQLSTLAYSIAVPDGV